MRTADRTLVTGFGPYLNIKENPSAKLANKLGRPYRILEVSFSAVDSFLSEINEGEFDRLLMLGVRPHGQTMCFEAFAHNRIGAEPDVCGVVAPRRTIRRPAPMLLKSTMMDAKVEEWIVSERDPQIELSCDAGKYLCNYIFFEALSRFAQKKVGFVHVTQESAISLESQTATILSLLSIVEG